MHPTRFDQKLCIHLGVACVLSLGACNDANDVSAGSLRVSTATTGGDIDADGYVLRFDNGWTLNLAPSGQADLTGIRAGTYAVTIEGVAENCEVVGEAGRRVTINAGRVAILGIEVRCRTAGLQVSMITDGPDLPQDAFLVMVAGRDTAFAIAPNGVLLLRLTGTHTIDVVSRVPSCSVHGPVRQVVEVTPAQLTRISFHGRCVAVTGAVEVAIVSAGVDLDPNGFRVRLGSGSAGVPVPVNGTTWLERLSAGRFDIALYDVAPNCVPDGPHIRSVEVKVGGLVRDTARIRFDVACVRTDKIAFVHRNSIVVAYADGSNAVVFGEGFEPSWSPRGDRLVVEAAVCPAHAGAASAGAYPENPVPTCERVGLTIIDPETRTGNALTSVGLDRNPAWSPSGDMVAFDRAGIIHLVRVSDGYARALPIPAFHARQVAWSPDGRMLAFSCSQAEDESGICLINVDGTGFRPLRYGLAVDAEPAWSPDGSRIAFTTTAFTGREDIATVNPDGTGVVRVTAGSSASWLPDGTRLLFEVTGRGIGSVRLDGSAFTLITRQEEHAPAWRP